MRLNWDIKKFWINNFIWNTAMSLCPLCTKWIRDGHDWISGHYIYGGNYIPQCFGWEFWSDSCPRKIQTMLSTIALEKLPYCRERLRSQYFYHGKTNLLRWACGMMETFHFIYRENPDNNQAIIEKKYKPKKIPQSLAPNHT